MYSLGRLLTLDLISLHVIRKNFEPDTNNAELPTANSGQIPSGSLSTSQQTNKSSTSLPSDSADSVSTIISYHAESSPTTSASTLHMRLMAAGEYDPSGGALERRLTVGMTGRSVYWSNIFKSTVPSGDPTFVTLSLLWYPLYAWDEVLDALLGEVAFLVSSYYLYSHIFLPFFLRKPIPYLPSHLQVLRKKKTRMTKLTP